MLPRDARLTCPGEEVWTLPGAPGWREVTRKSPGVTRKSQWSERLVGAPPPGSTRTNPFLLWRLVPRCH